MTANNDLNRFIEAQKQDYEIALAEIKNGKKRSHWMWYIFPQIAGLGYSETSKFYAIKGVSEAQAYLSHPVLGKRLIRICEALLQLKTNNATEVFGSPDDLKLQSCLTLFAILPDTNPIFQSVLDYFFHGSRDLATIQIVKKLLL